MKTIATFGLLLSLFMGLGCASGPRTSATPQEMAALDRVISDGTFKIVAQWAQPMASRGLNSIANAGLLPRGSSAGRIDIAGSGGYFKMDGDRTEADLPYFGERHMGGGYEPDKAGIRFKGTPKDYSLGPIQKGDGYTMRFSINEGQETFQVLAQIYATGHATVSVASTHRTTIWYQGRLLDENQD